MKYITEARKKLNETSRVVGNQLYPSFGDRLARSIYPPTELSEGQKAGYSEVVDKFLGKTERGYVPSTGMYCKLQKVHSIILAVQLAASSFAFLGIPYIRTRTASLDTGPEIVETANKFKTAINTLDILKKELGAVKLPEMYSSDKLRPFLDVAFKERKDKQLNLEQAISILLKEGSDIEKELNNKRNLAREQFLNSFPDGFTLFCNTVLPLYTAGLMVFNRLRRNYSAYKLGIKDKLDSLEKLEMEGQLK